MKIVKPFILFGLLFTNYACDGGKTPFERIGVKINPEFEIKGYAKKNSKELEATGAKGEHIYIEALSEKYPVGEKREDYYKRVTFHYEGLYKEYITPYPGILSNQKGCPEELNGKATVHEISDVEKSTHIWAYANSRRVVGECLKNLNKFYFYKTVLECGKEKKLYSVELYLPFDHYSFEEKVIANCIL
jgi:hypothetical protein